MYNFVSSSYWDTSTFWGKNKQGSFTHNTECIYFSRTHTCTFISFTYLRYFMHSNDICNHVWRTFFHRLLSKRPTHSTIINNNTITHFIAEALGSLQRRFKDWKWNERRKKGQKDSKERKYPKHSLQHLLQNSISLQTSSVCHAVFSPRFQMKSTITSQLFPLQECKFSGSNNWQCLWIFFQVSTRQPVHRPLQSVNGMQAVDN